MYGVAQLGSLCILSQSQNQGIVFLSGASEAASFYKKI